MIFITKRTGRALLRGGAADEAIQNFQNIDKYGLLLRCAHRNDGMTCMQDLRCRNRDLRTWVIFITKCARQVVIARRRSRRSNPLQSVFCVLLDCFAALAMTMITVTA
jgi:hypothetical protein